MVNPGKTLLAPLYQGGNSRPAPPLRRGGRGIFSYPGAYGDKGARLKKPTLVRGESEGLGPDKILLKAVRTAGHAHVPS